MKIDCISDLLGHYPELEGGDLLIVAGDLTARDTPEDFTAFLDWLSEQPYTRRVFIGGNHDTELAALAANGTTISGRHVERTNLTYLFDSGTEFEGLKIWGSPWTMRFDGMNPDCMSFTVETEEELAEKWALIPDDTDILVTHCPPYGFLDEARNPYNNKKISCGSDSLWQRLKKLNVRCHIFGHIHEGGGDVEVYQDLTWNGPIFVNASYVNEHYEPANKPITVEL